MLQLDNVSTEPYKRRVHGYGKYFQAIKHKNQDTPNNLHRIINYVKRKKYITSYEEISPNVNCLLVVSGVMGTFSFSLFLFGLISYTSVLGTIYTLSTFDFDYVRAGVLKPTSNLLGFLPNALNQVNFLRANLPLLKVLKPAQGPSDELREFGDSKG